MYAASYLRRSSADETDNQGQDSLGSQEQATQLLHQLHAPTLQLVEFKDWGLSGGKDDRPEFVRLKTAIAAGEVAWVLAKDLSRLGRSARSLDDLFNLCQEHHVRLIVAKEGDLSDDSATGQLVRGMMALVVQWERKSGVERSRDARAARKTRYADAGLVEPSAISVYGEHRVRVAGATSKLSLVELDPERPIGVLLDAYSTAGTLRGACVILHRAGVAGPRPCRQPCSSQHHRKGTSHGKCLPGCSTQHAHPGQGWAISTLRRILDHYSKPHDGVHEAMVTLPEKRGPLGIRRSVTGLGLFAGLLTCPCGRSMTSNPARKEYYCAAGRLHQSPHRRTFIQESKLLPALKAEADRYLVDWVSWRKSGEMVVDAEVDRLSAANDAIQSEFLKGRLASDRYEALRKANDEALASIARQGRMRVGLRLETVPGWDDVQAMNAHLRKIWLRVDLDESFQPHVVWGIPEAKYAEPYASADDDPGSWPPGAEKWSDLEEHH